MKRNIKRLPALLLAILLCLNLLPGTALALEISGEGWKFDLTDMPPGPAQPMEKGRRCV